MHVTRRGENREEREGLPKPDWFMPDFDPRESARWGRPAPASPVGVMLLDCGPGLPSLCSRAAAVPKVGMAAAAAPAGLPPTPVHRVIAAAAAAAFLSARCNIIKVGSLARPLALSLACSHGKRRDNNGGEENGEGGREREGGERVRVSVVGCEGTPDRPACRQARPADQTEEKEAPFGH